MNDIDKIVDEKIGKDADFQASLADKSEDDKNDLIEAKRKELAKSEFASVAEKAQKNEELAGNYKTRAEKAEDDVKKYKPADQKKDEEKGLSPKDTYALINAKVPEEDLETVMEYAKFKGISVADALKAPILTTVLADNEAKRVTAAATQTRSTRSTTKIDGNTIVDDMKNKGETSIPSKGSKEAEAAFWARRGRPVPNQ